MSSTERDAVIVDVMRTTMGKRGGALSNWHPVDLLAFALTTLVDRTGVDPETVDDVIGGCVTQSGEQGTNVTRNGWVAAGLPQSVPATTVDRQCGSSQQAMHFAAAGVKAGHYDLVVACGVESMTRAPMASNARGGHRALPAVVPRRDRRAPVGPVPGGPGPGRPVGRDPRADGRVRPGKPPPGRRLVGLGPLRQRGGAGARQGRGRHDDRRVPGDGRGDTAERHTGGTGRTASGPELGAGHGTGHHRRQLHRR